MRSAARLLTTFIPVVPLALSLGCPDGDVTSIAPTINVDVCATPADVRNSAGDIIGGTDDCVLDFGVQDISVRVQREITVSNISTIDLRGAGTTASSFEDLDIQLTTDSDPAFQIELKPVVVESGLSKKILISFRPTLESEVTGRLIISSDAENVPAGQDVVIELTGTGVDNGVPDILVSPLECDFGRVAEGNVKECKVDITNNGGRDLVFDDVFLKTSRPDPNDPTETEILPKVPQGSTGEIFGFFGRPPARDDVVPAPPEDNTVTLTLRFSPDALGNYYSEVSILSNDPDTPEITVPLIGIGVDPPSCAVRIKSINGIEGAGTIEPLDDVILTAEDSAAPTASGTIEEYRWEILEKPPSSTVVLSDPAGTTTGFTFDNGDDLGVDFSGTYKVRLTVVDDLGTESINECEVEFEAIPKDSFLIELSWDTSVNDMDLHLTKRDSGGQYCPSSVDPGPLADSCSSEYEDCYFGSCKATKFDGTPNEDRPDWDGIGGGSSEGDPSLDIDDLSGYGPENINIDQAVEGEYLVGVDYWGGSGTVGATIRIYIYGQLAAEFYKELQPSDWWEVGVLHWPAPGNGAPCLQDLSNPASQCN